VREVLREIGAGEVPELIVINKADVADPITVETLRVLAPGSAVVSAASGAGIEDLLARLDDAIPRRDREIAAVVPYHRGDLLARAHQEGEVLDVTHGEDGTLVKARVPAGLAAELERAGGVATAAAAANGGDPWTGANRT
jgi:GTP-binding protein HflX